MKKLNLVLFFAMAVISMTLNAQIRYYGGSLSISSPYIANTSLNNPGSGLTINNWKYCDWRMANNCMFRIEIANKAVNIAGARDMVQFYNSSNMKWNSIFVSNVFNSSDARAKTNVRNVNSGLSSLLQLRPVTFNWKSENEVSANSVALQDDALTFEADTDNSLQYGFLAQEVEEVLPDIVKTQDNGDKLVNYIALIPLLVQSIQELQQTVEAQAQAIERLSSNQQVAKKDSYNKILSISPNPTNGHVSINIQLSANVNSAQIIISSLTGNRERTINVTESQSSFSEDISSLANGIYLISLFTNGMLADSCRLIKE